jgi:hypothetical protein
VAIVEGAQATATEVIVGELVAEDWLPLPQLVKAVMNKETKLAKRW